MFLIWRTRQNISLSAQLHYTMSSVWQQRYGDDRQSRAQNMINIAPLGRAKGLPDPTDQSIPLHDTVDGKNFYGFVEVNPKTRNIYHVRSQRANENYMKWKTPDKAMYKVMTLKGVPSTCTCPDAESHHCKHMRLVAMYIESARDLTRRPQTRSQTRAKRSRPQTRAQTRAQTQAQDLKETEDRFEACDGG
jgi:hypothetical protein